MSNVIAYIIKVEPGRYFTMEADSEGFAKLTPHIREAWRTFFYRVALFRWCKIGGVARVLTINVPESERGELQP